ncbi:Aldo/keto reductase [Aspergillus homomorphus CBS 101889]|uniref:Aldo/keto reductase n=1 Tax=Aspergillus homomorphus (strain CBS 101889) TaxID=1450537 RepID=A0A395HVK5_ASPHC|nr:Aldo/keto reductase [Aspergillus homomorphus CBS 101889]RAL11425.1 Aldo/keto reductase [Aspergillus homomorphus CBS 101889]
MPTTTTKPRIILGLMTFSPDPNQGARITSLSEFGACLGYFTAQGYTEVDTAQMYIGEQQEAFTAAQGMHSPDVLRRKFTESLMAVQTEQVDIFCLHAADRSAPFADTLAAVNTVAEIVTLCHERGWERLTVIQGMYNAINGLIYLLCVWRGCSRNIEPELIPCCRRYSLEIVVYNPLAGGILSGKYNPGAAKPEEGRFSDKNTTGALYRQPYFNDAVLTALGVIRAAAEKHGLTLPEITFRWIRHHSQLQLGDQGKDGILIGVSSFEQLQQNLAMLERSPLPEEVVNAVDEAWMDVKATSANYWHLDLKYTYDTQAVLFGK